MASIEALQRQDSTDGVRSVLEGALDRYGFDRFIISGLPDKSKDIRKFVVLSRWDEEWFARYSERDYLKVDPMVRHCFATSLPFDWAAAPYDRENNAAARQMLDEARDFGMTNGICVPLHLENGMQGIFSLVGDPTRLQITERLELQMLSLYTLGQLRFVSTFSAEDTTRRTITPREAEVLKWAAMGKTAGEIAEITGTTVRTVNQHCENAQRRLGTRNRLHTVVEAMRRNLITL